MRENTITRRSVMTWSTLFRDFIQPVLFAGLFVMTFIGLRISLKNQKREKSK